MNEVKFKCVILRSTQISDNTNLLTVLTDTRGKKLITCHGAKKLSGRSMPAVQPFCCSEITATEKAGRLTLKEASLIESFFDLRCDLLSACLGMYMLESVAECAREEEDETELLQLLLNSLYALGKRLCPCDQIKAAFELRLLMILGSAPSDFYCARCGTPVLDGGAAYSVSEGGLLCYKCSDGNAQGVLNAGAREALHYILRCPPKRIFSFTLPEKHLKELSTFSQECILYFFEHNFETLKFYNRVKNESTEET